MPLHSVAIRNYQSLHDVSVDLSRFTVIVGPSSSGKSAFIRALHTLVHNRRGLDFLTHGQRLMTITAVNDHSTITLSRGKGTADDYYEVIPSTPADAAPHAPTGPTPQRWTKLGGTVPEEVSQALGISPDSDSFASQHDMPYLLSPKQYSPSTVATILGKLTNVSVIFEAARESKRQALDASKTLKLRASDLSTATAALSKFDSLPEQQKHITDAEEKISAAAQAQRQLIAISAARDALIAAGSTVKRLSSAADITIPDLTPLIEAQQRLSALTSTRDELTEAAGDYRALQQRMSTLGQEQADLDNERVDLHQDMSQVFEAAFRAPGYGPDIPIEFAAPIAATTIEELST